MTIIQPYNSYQAWRAQALKGLEPGVTPLLPQSGFQYKFLKSKADIVWGGGSAGGGKTYALLIEAARHRWNPRFSAMVFRRSMPEIKNPGGLWDEANELYGKTVGGIPRENPLTWSFPSDEINSKKRARVVFSHLQHEKDVLSHHGGQYPLICFDELYTFSQKQFWYLLSRNRSSIGMRPLIRGTTNPQTEGWVKDFISWYLYPDEHPDPSKAGYPIPERDGVVRWFARDGGHVFWGNTPKEVIMQVPHLFKKDDGIALKDKLKSFTFIQGDVYGNRELLKVNPGYISNLLAQDADTRDKLLYGCWKYRSGGHELFNYDGLLDFFSNSFVEKLEGARNRYLTCDIALEGSDLFVINYWEGFRLVKTYSYERSPGDLIIKVIKELASIHGVPQSNIAYDRDGAGGFLAGILPAAYGFRANGRPLKEPWAKKGDPAPNYENLKTQCAYVAAGMIERAELYCEPQGMDEWQKNRLVEECRAHLKRDKDKSLKLKISQKSEVKERLPGKRSPDFFDAFIMRMVFLFRSNSQSQTA